MIDIIIFLLIIVGLAVIGAAIDGASPSPIPRGNEQPNRTNL
jgi:hypothetical protein